MLCKKSLEFQRKQLCWSTFQACNFIKKILQRRCFSVKFAKFLRTRVSASVMLNHYNDYSRDHDPTISNVFQSAVTWYAEIALNVFYVMCKFRYSVNQWNYDTFRNLFLKFLKLKVHKCRFENLPICSDSYKNNILKVFHS